MVKLIYWPIASLDGYIEDEQGKFDWAPLHDEVHGSPPGLRKHERDVLRDASTR
jgi:hypothetical protein